MLTNLPEEAPGKSGRASATISRNIAATLARVLVSSLVALVLPAYLTHHLPVATYGAWVLILQLGAYISFLDFGIQTGVAKFVAEHKARGDEAAAGRYASAGFAFMALAGLLGLALTLALAWQVPRLFHSMPVALYRDVRISVALIGASLSFGLVCSVFSAVFLGLQRYSIAMAISIVSRVAFTAVVLTAVMLHGSLAAMGAAAATVNIGAGLLQVIAWRKFAARIRVSLALVDSSVLKQMARYCFLLAIWTVGMVCVSGMDVTIVGHYDYYQTAYYSIATLPTNFLLVIISALLGPLMPAVSALSTQRSASEMGDVLARSTRYSTTILLCTGLPLLVCGFPVLRLWVGPAYALHSLSYLRILVIANILRNLCAPYATMIAATNRQGAATAAAVSEAAVNLGSSIYLASRFGALGVAVGTLIGSLVSVSLHFLATMRFTSRTLAVSRSRLFARSILWPARMALPTVLLLPFWGFSSRNMLGPWMFLLWGLSTLLLLWFGNLTLEERSKLLRFAKTRIALQAAPG